MRDTADLEEVIKARLILERVIAAATLGLEAWLATAPERWGSEGLSGRALAGEEWKLDLHELGTTARADTKDISEAFQRICVRALLGDSLEAVRSARPLRDRLGEAPWYPFAKRARDTSGHGPFAISKFNDGLPEVVTWRNISISKADAGKPFPMTFGDAYELVLTMLEWTRDVERDVARHGL